MNAGGGEGHLSRDCTTEPKAKACYKCQCAPLHSPKAASAHLVTGVQYRRPRGSHRTHVSMAVQRRSLMCHPQSRDCPDNSGGSGGGGARSGGGSGAFGGGSGGGSSGAECYRCGKTGHIARACPDAQASGGGGSGGGGGFSSFSSSNSRTW